jgi:hypothetical protein
MPKTPSTGFWHKPLLWRAANARMLIRCGCSRCQKVQHYLAMDLVPMFGSDAVVGELWGRCPRCGSSQYWFEQERYPNNDDVGFLEVRRPNGFRYVRQWKTEIYGPPPYGPPWPPPVMFGGVKPGSDWPGD